MLLNFQNRYPAAVRVSLVILLLGAFGVDAKQVPKNQSQIALSFAPLVKKVAPAVVNIYTQKLVRAGRGTPSLFNDPFFKRFFGDNFGVPFTQPKSRRQNSLGSGVIVDPNGLIVTNGHVIQGADEIRVVLSDRREFVAETLGIDKKTDLAILKIDSRGKALPFIEMNDSDELEVGDLVLAIGNPFGVGQTVTNGIVSALARTQIGKSDLNSFIQTDAAINPGNSGGALVSMDGRLAGINTAIYSKSGGSHGIGFAVPSNMVRAVVRGVSASGRLVRPWFGATGQAVSQEIADSLGLDRPSGVLVSAVYKSGAAAEAGIEVGDVVLAVNGHEVNDPVGLRHRIATLPVGESAAVRVWRSGKIRAVGLQLAPPPEQPPRMEMELQGDQPLSGAVIVNMSPALAEEITADPFLEGVLLLRIKHGSPANRLGFRAGDFIRSINSHSVSRVRELKKQLDRKTDRWRITILRNGRSQELVINR